MKKLAVFAVAMVLLAPSILLAQDEYTCDLTPVDGFVEKGIEKARFDLTVYNNTDSQADILVGLTVMGHNGLVYNWLFGPQAVPVAAGGQADYLDFATDYVPTNLPNGTYTFHAFIREPDGGIYHKCQCNFEIFETVPDDGDHNGGLACTYCHGSVGGLHHGTTGNCLLCHSWY